MSPSEEDVGRADRTPDGDCEADGPIGFICGQNNPEDLADIPGSPWVIASTYSTTADDGYLSALHQRNGWSVRLYPDESAGTAPDNTYSGCSQKPDAYNSHGIGLLPGRNGVHTLAAVRHKGRDSIEIFRVDARGSQPRLTWVGCVLEPAGHDVDFNSVAWLPDGGLAVTGFATNNVWEWRPGTGWSEVPGTRGIDQPNGIEVSPDGRWLYIGAYEGRTIYRISRESTPEPTTTLPVDFKIDNLHFDDHGQILAAGAEATPEQSRDCALLGQCAGVTSRAIRVDPDLSEVEPLFTYPANDRFGMATTAIQVHSRIWIGSFGPSVAVIKDRGRHR